MNLARKRILRLNVVLLIIEALLSCGKFGYGLGDLFYLIPIWVMIIIHALIYIFYVLDQMKPSILLTAVFLVADLFFLYTFFFNRGLEMSYW